MTITVPQFYNDSKPVNSIVLMNVEMELIERYDGFSRTEVFGAWQNYHGSKTYREKSYRYEILHQNPCRHAYQDLKILAKELCKTLYQECILTTCEIVESVDYVS